jgi:hypothetical protein
MADFINARKLPSKGTPGDVYRDASSKRMYLALGDGTLCDLADLLSESRPVVRAVGPQGEQGRAGLDSQVPGPAGRDGRDGKDSTVSGPAGPKGEKGDRGASIKGDKGDKGDSIKGDKGDKGDSIKGEKGDPGDVLYVGPDAMAAAVKSLRDEMIATKARMEAAFDVTFLEAQQNRPNGAVTIHSYLNRMRQRAGVTKQDWTPEEMAAIRNYFNKGGTVQELIATALKG